MNGQWTTMSASIREWCVDWVRGWDRFWFSRRDPHTLAVIRLACGAMLVYVHVIWSSLLLDFMGSHAWLNSHAIRDLHANDAGWSWLFYVESAPWLWLHQLLAITASVMVMLGLATRVAIPVAWWLTLMVCHRMTGALFGLDQVVVMLSMYLMWGRSGSVYSLDALIRSRTGRDGWWFPVSGAAISNNVVTRLIQLHLCVIYLFGGLSKMRGEMWFDGSALWFTAVNFEYQSLDLTWMGNYPFIIASLTAATIFWETFYCALVWPRKTRPLVLAMAVSVHGGIALALGMVTFGTIMIVANLAFVPAYMTRAGIDHCLPKRA